MQLCPFKDLRRWIAERERVERGECLEICRQIVDGLVHVHAHSVIHRDLKPDNIFISEDHHILLGDFGLAKSIADTDQGTYLYIAPEILNLQVCTTRSDIYSLGILMVELFYGFETAMERAVILNALKTKGTIPSTIPPDVADLIERLIHPDPSSRPSALEILHDPLLSTEPLPASSST
ncbi:kinase-like domain-containing protein, partial [Chytridium lagenaria]